MRSWPWMPAVLVAWMSVGVVPAAASPALPEDECVELPEHVATIEVADPFDARLPAVLGKHVWFDGSIYLTDGTLLGPAPQTGLPEGEAPYFTEEIVGYDDVTWGVIDNARGAAVVWSPDGTELVEVPARAGLMSAVYDDEAILVAEAVRTATISELHAYLVTRDLDVVGFDVPVAEENGRFGAVADGTVALVTSEGALALFDLSGDPIAVLESADGLPFDRVIAAHGRFFVHTKREIYVSNEGSLTIVAPDASVIASVELDGTVAAMGPTPGGIALELVHFERVAASPTEEYELHRRFPVLSPRGRLITEIELTGPFEDDQIFRSHGRYLLLEDRISVETVQGQGVEAATSRLHLVLGDGRDLGATRPFVSPFRSVLGRPAGTTLFVYGPDGRSVSVHSLSGRMLGELDLGLREVGEIRISVTDHRFVWVVVVDAADEAGADPRGRALVFDLGACAGLPTAGAFVDDDGTVFEADIEAIAAARITRGCNPADANTRSVRANRSPGVRWRPSCTGRSHR